jgi:homoserine dehydrogenase
MVSYLAFPGNLLLTINQSSLWMPKVDIFRPREYEVPSTLRTTDYREVIESSDIVVELVGGKDFAKRLLLEALEKGKHVVTANKHLLAEEGEEIFKKAKEMGL